MAPRTFFAPVILALAAVPAAAGVTVIGKGSAELCYQAAERDGAASASGLAYCDDALEKETLGKDDRVATLVNRGILKLRRGDIEPAIADFDAAIARDPEEADAYLNKGMPCCASRTDGGRRCPCSTRPSPRGRKSLQSHIMAGHWLTKRQAGCLPPIATIGTPARWLPTGPTRNANSLASRSVAARLQLFSRYPVLKIQATTPRQMKKKASVIARLTSTPTSDVP